MNKVQFIFGVHNHQPVGNFDYVIEAAYQRSYRPFLELAEVFPSIALVMHFSGCLLEWLEDHHPDFLDRVAALVARGNVEILSSGFFEPVLSSIPDRDKRGQIARMNRYLKQHFRIRPQGLWLAERVWEPHLAKPIRQAGIRYLAVDDYHFLSSGKEAAELTGYFTTEEQGWPLGLFPISQALRYAIPFEDYKVTLQVLKSRATPAGENLVVMVDDGEKYGVWPGSYRRCFGREKWLEGFFHHLVENQDWLSTTTFRDYYAGHRPAGRVYLPTGSYFEMGEWSLPPDQGSTYHRYVKEFTARGELDAVRPFLRGGTWRNFMSIYEESNWMYQRMLEVSGRLEAGRRSGRIASREREAIQTHLYRAQCNCAYWHGIFGGLYLPHLRHAIYRELLQAEERLDHLEGVNTRPGDLDNDGLEEYRLASGEVKLILSPRGGTIRELDYLPEYFNLLNTMRRYRESYHARVGTAYRSESGSGSIHNQVRAKEAGLEKKLQVDPWLRQSLVDHFLPAATTLKAMRNAVPEQGSLVEAPYQVRIGAVVELVGEGLAFGQRVRLEKDLRLVGGVLDIHIRIHHRGRKTIRGLYACELNFSLLGGHTPHRHYLVDGVKPRRCFLDSSAVERSVRTISLVNRYDSFKVDLIFQRPADAWRYPVETVSMSERGFEKIYQSSVVVPFWKLRLAPGEQAEVKFALAIKPVRD